MKKKRYKKSKMSDTGLVTFNGDKVSINSPLSVSTLDRCFLLVSTGGKIKANKSYATMLRYKCRELRLPFVRFIDIATINDIVDCSVFVDDVMNFIINAEDYGN